MRTASVTIALVVSACSAFAGDFADFVVDCTPAPGQFINGGSNPEGFTFGDPAAALGAPVGGGTTAPNNSKLVSLGSFGGAITLGFSETVMDDPLNPMGLDAIVFGNAYWLGGNPQSRWAEAGVIEISADANANGLADDPWYVIPGTDINPTNPAGAFVTQQWDNDGATPTPPAELSWYPDPVLFPQIGSTYATSGYALPAAFDGLVLNNSASPQPGTLERYFGYADLSPTLVLGDLDSDGVVDAPTIDPGAFYTVPDNPFVVGIDEGSGGGDAFDIAWAVDPATGEPAHLRGFDFIRIRTGSTTIAGVFSEKSTEVGGVADAREASALAFDVNEDNALDIEDLYDFFDPAFAVVPAADLNGDTVVDETDSHLLERAVRRAELSPTNPFRQ